MKIVLLTQYFPPEMGAAQNRLIALARAFRDSGHDLTVLTSLPNYPTGQIFDGYDKHFKMTEEIEGIRVIRTWLYQHKSRKVIPTVMSYITFAMTALNVGLRDIDSVDVLMWEYPPLFLGYTAQKLARKWNARLVTNIADMWTKAIEDEHMLSHGFILNSLKNYENKIIRRSSLLTTQTQKLIENIKNNVPESNPLLWANGADIDQFDPQKSTKKLNSSKFIVGYAGLHGRIHNLKLILEAAKVLRNNNEIQFYFYGDGYEKKSLLNFVKNEKLTNVEFYNPVPHSQLPDILASFDIGIVIHKNLPSMKCVRSAKLFELMAMGIPILHCAESEGADLVREAEAGIVVSDPNPESIAQSILEMKNNDNLGKWSVNGRQFVVEKFNRKGISHKIVKLVEDLLLSSD